MKAASSNTANTKSCLRGAASMQGSTAASSPPRKNAVTPAIRRRHRRMQLHLYQWLTRLLSPFIDLYLLKRRLAGKEDAVRFRERLGHAGLARPQGALVWVHAASVGEAVSVLSLIRSITEALPKAHVLVTTGTVTSAEMLAKRLPRRAMHQYVPVDKVHSVRRFLRHWRPDLALWVESELWPNLIVETHKTGCPLVQVNATLSVESVATWQKAKKLAHRMLESFSLTLPQTEEDGKRLASLGAKNIRFVGNLKFEAPALPVDPKEVGSMLTMIGNRPVWVAASTHAGEEIAVAKAHLALKKQFPDILTILVPRHPNRRDEILETLAPESLSIAVRSKSEVATAATDIYLADTLGELGLFYRLSNIVFMGGSLIEQGGHNPLEPARLECALITGPHIHHFTPIFNELIAENACIKIEHAEALPGAVANLLSDKTMQKTMCNAALDFVESKGSVVADYMEALGPFITQLKATS
ncbi:MAG: 3-deoxy-D-manno-octulosonic acid transferase [Proteobacteria bacterium]|nr:3-deoxy-D-manno-octulosonic acid transferase [Pseudomonadota bacterium]